MNFVNLEKWLNCEEMTEKKTYFYFLKIFLQLLTDVTRSSEAHDVTNQWRTEHFLFSRADTYAKAMLRSCWLWDSFGVAKPLLKNLPFSVTEISTLLFDSHKLNGHCFHANYIELENGVGLHRTNWITILNTWNCMYRPILDFFRKCQFAAIIGRLQI